MHDSLLQMQKFQCTFGYIMLLPIVFRRESWIQTRIKNTSIAPLFGIGHAHRKYSVHALLFRNRSH